jgi:hypothetical protein
MAAPYASTASTYTASSDTRALLVASFVVGPWLRAMALSRSTINRSSSLAPLQLAQ